MTRGRLRPFYFAVALGFHVAMLGCRSDLITPDPLPTPAAPWSAQPIYLPEVTQAWQSVTGPVTPDVVSDKCQNCDGTGRVGDTRTEKVCPECNGTGKKSTRAASSQADECDDAT